MSERRDETTIRYLKQALKELADIADMIHGSTDSAHWDRLDRSIDQARRLCND